MYQLGSVILLVCLNTNLDVAVTYFVHMINVGNRLTVREVVHSNVTGPNAVS